MPTTDNQPFKFHYHGVDINITSDARDPSYFDAVVEEQDTALVLGESREIRDPDKPAWYLAHKLVSQQLYTPGQIIIKHSQPLRLLAIVHNFDEEPSWCLEWVAQALNNMDEIIRQYAIESIAMPLLGCQFGRILPPEFITLLFEQLKSRQQQTLKQLGLLIPDDDRAEILALINEIIQ